MYKRQILYCSADILKTGLDPCITAITNSVPDNILENCELQPTQRRNTALRLSPSKVYYDQNGTMATQKCGNVHSFSLSGQGTFTIPPACSLTFNGASFRNTDPQEINHHQPQQPTQVLTFSDSAILDNKLDFPDQRPSFVTKNESIIAHALLVLFVAMISLLTKLVYSLTARYTSKQDNPTTTDPETMHHEPSAPIDQAEYNNTEQNIQMYHCHSRILSPLDIEHQWNSYT